jgi:hypothetical protein
LAYPAVPVIKKEYTIFDSVSVHKSTTVEGKTTYEYSLQVDEETVEDYTVEIQKSQYNSSITINLVKDGESTSVNDSTLDLEDIGDITKQKAFLETFKPILDKYGFKYTESEESVEIPEFSFIESSKNLYKTKINNVGTEKEPIYELEVIVVNKVFTVKDSDTPVKTKSFDYDQYILCAKSEKDITIDGNTLPNVAGFSTNDEKENINSLFTVTH